MVHWRLRLKKSELLHSCNMRINTAAIAPARSKPLKVRIYGSDVCESLVALIQEKEQSVAIVDEKRVKEVVEKYSNHEREFIEEEKDPSYSPEAEEQEEVVEDEDEDEDVVAPSPEAAPLLPKRNPKNSPAERRM